MNMKERYAQRHAERAARERAANAHTEIRPRENITATKGGGK